MLGTRAVRSPLEPITGVGVPYRPNYRLADHRRSDQTAAGPGRRTGLHDGPGRLGAGRSGLAPVGHLRTTGMLMSLPLLVLFLSSLWLLRRFLRAAGRPGRLYSLDSARRLGFLGWYLAAGAVLAGIIESVASGVVLAQQTSGVAWGPTELRFPWFAFLVGLGVITCARVMRIGVTMREDLDGTV